MAFFNQLLNYLWQILTFVGGITAAVGVFPLGLRRQGPRRAGPRRARSGSSPSAAPMAAIGLVGGSYLTFPTM